MDNEIEQVISALSISDMVDFALNEHQEQFQAKPVLVCMHPRLVDKWVAEDNKDLTVLPKAKYNTMFPEFEYKGVIVVPDNLNSYPLIVNKHGKAQYI